MMTEKRKNKFQKFDSNLKCSLKKMLESEKTEFWEFFTSDYSLCGSKKLTWHSNLVSDLEICRKDPGLL